MCKELEAIGLPYPDFNNKTFILKTTVMSASYSKLPIETTKVADSDKITINNEEHIYEQLDTNQVFGTAYIVKMLECSDRTARNIISKLKEMEAIVPVKGIGKGMYRLKNENE